MKKSNPYNLVFGKDDKRCPENDEDGSVNKDVGYHDAMSRSKRRQYVPANRRPGFDESMVEVLPTEPMRRRKSK